MHSMVAFSEKCQIFTYFPEKSPCLLYPTHLQSKQCLSTACAVRVFFR